MMKQPIFGKPRVLPLEKNEVLKNTGAETDHLRILRKPLLDAFDIYKSNVYYGILSETDGEHTEIMAWYNQLCDTENPEGLREAIENVPAKIEKYLR